MNQSFKIAGMTCAACAVSVESYIKPLDGVHNVEVNYPNQSSVIDFDEEVIPIETIQEKLKEIGYDLLLGDEVSVKKEMDQKDSNRLELLRKKLIFSAFFSIPIFVMAMFFMGKIPYENWIMLALSIPVLVWSGSEFYSIAWKKLKHFSANMDTLVALSTGTAFLFSLINTINPTLFRTDDMQHTHVYYESAVVIITLILFGRYLE